MEMMEMIEMMGMMDMIVLGLLGLLVIILLILISKNSKLSDENKKLTEILEVKDVAIANYEASGVVVNDAIENFSFLDEVMSLINQGESKASVSKELNIPLSNIELIIKFDKIKNKNS